MTHEQKETITKITEEIKAFLTSPEYGQQIISILKDIVNLPEYKSGKFHNEYCTAKEAADLLGVSVQTVNNWRMKGHLTGYQYGDQIRYHLSDISRLFHVQKIIPKVSKVAPLHPYTPVNGK